MRNIKWQTKQKRDETALLVWDAQPDRLSAQTNNWAQRKQAGPSSEQLTREPMLIYFDLTLTVTTVLIEW